MTEPAQTGEPVVLRIPELCLVALVGVSGSGKTTFAARHFAPTEVLSSDGFRAMVSDDENDLTATSDAFDSLYYLASKRLRRRRLTVIDATSVQQDARAQILRLAKEHDVLPVAIVLDVPKSECARRNRERPDRQFGDHVLRNQHAQLRRSIKLLRREGFRYVYVLSGTEEVDAAVLERQRLWTNRTDLTGPFDIVGDVHGCYDELCDLLAALGWRVSGTPSDPRVDGPPGRTAVFLGDLVDRGPATPSVLRLVMRMVADGSALCVPGNHDVKLVKWLGGRNVRVAHGLQQSIDQLAAEPEAFKEEVRSFLDGLVSHYLLDGGRLVVAHAGLIEAYQGRASGRVRSFALYGQTTGETDDFGLPVRHDWASEYKGRAAVVYGHTPVPEPEWLNNTINIDTGCVFGGALTALRYPERELVTVPAHRTYQEPARPIAPKAENGNGLTGQQLADDVLDVADVTGRRIVHTRLAGNVTVREENATAALEVMSRWAIDPRWLIYLPPTMSPPATSSREGYLEHPDEAFDYYRKEGLDAVVCERKHMGSRAVAVVCRAPEVARARFGVVEPRLGAIYTRTGRPFFEESLEDRVLERIGAAIGRAGLWDELSTDWLCLDAEIMPWSFKAVELLRGQYASVGAAARAGLADTLEALRHAASRGVETEALEAHTAERLRNARAFVDAYRGYCWPYEGIDDLAIAPFHVLASEGAVHADRPHSWHLDTIARIAEADEVLLRPTEALQVDLTSPASVSSAVAWWEESTAGGSEGMVVKPAEFLARGRRGLVQAAIKCRGRAYLRLIYGPDYLRPEHLEKLKDRKVGRKRSLAHREQALGIQALESFVARRPLRHTHACVFAILALESEPVDPRL